MTLRIKFFITPVYPYGNDHYFHEIIAVAEGFKELGHHIFGNCDYWWQPETDSFLIKGEPDNKNYDIGIYDYRYVTSFAHLLFREGYPNFDKPQKHILIDRNDWISPIWWNNEHYKMFDLIFAANIYDHVKYPSNVKPWAIGLTNRIIKNIDRFYDENADREKIVAYNFRVDHNMRGYILKDLKEKLRKYPATERLTLPDFDNQTDEFYHKTTTKRHNPRYFKSLCSSLFYMAFGGLYEFKPLIYQPYNLIEKLIRKPAYWRYKYLKSKGQDFSHLVFIFQHDSFRFWESLYGGAITIHIDLSYWNFLMPEMPIAGKHYLGIQKLKDNQLEEVIAEMTPQQLKDISESGRKWVLKFYSPKAQAERILSFLK